MIIWVVSRQTTNIFCLSLHSHWWIYWKNLLGWILVFPPLPVTRLAWTGAPTFRAHHDRDPGPGSTSGLSCSVTYFQVQREDFRLILNDKPWGCVSIPQHKSFNSLLLVKLFITFKLIHRSAWIMEWSYEENMPSLKIYPKCKNHK